MSNQEQCPNCGGYKICQDIDRIDPTTGKKTPAGGCGIFILVFIVGLLLAIIGTMSENNILSYSGIVIIIYIGVPLYVWTEIRKGQTQKRAFDLYKYQCNLCGYQWNWREGQPQPIVNVRPDLIAKGEQRLEDERRKQQDPRIPLP